MISTNLRCGHCNALFVGTKAQAYNQRANPDSSVYCSSICRLAGAAKKATEQAIREGRKPRKGVLAGPCKNCGEMYESKTTDRQYCSIKCYGSSQEMRDRIKQYWNHSEAVRARISAGLKRGMDVPCLECGETFYQKPASNGRTAKKFCNTGCYRAFMAKRFDRWIANPGSMALPQGYDEFLDRDELDCVVEGCGWRGVHLTTHVNMAHGVPADEFKRAAGFNLTTGVIGRSLAEVLRERSCVGIAAQNDEERQRWLALSLEAMKQNVVVYKSLEGKEHYQKARALQRALQRTGPPRTCEVCGGAFVQATPSGHAKYCSLKCRNQLYYRRRSGKTNKTMREQQT